MTDMKEAEVLKQVLQYLQLCPGIYAWRANTGAVKVGKRFIRFGVPGMSDIQGVLPGGRALFVETKRSNGGRLSPAQAAFLARMRAAGGVAIIATDVDSVRQGLREAGVEGVP